MAMLKRLNLEKIQETVILKKRAKILLLYRETFLSVETLRSSTENC